VARRQAPRLLVVACICSLAALALMTWQLFDPRVFPIIIAMSMGQILGTASFVAYLYVVMNDLRRQYRRAETESEKVNAE
jgi:hypothetical protein